MVRWIFRLLILALIGFGFYHIAFHEAGDLSLPTPSTEAMAANLPGQDVSGQPEVRILVAEALDRATLTINGRVSMDVTTTGMKQERGEFTQSVAVEVIPTGRGIMVGTQQYVRVRMRSLDSQPIRLSWNNGQTTISVPREVDIYGTHVKEGDRTVAKVRILARMPIEEYLYGVLAGEVPTSWPRETLQAQAVASRTFAYFEVKSRAREEYDVKADTSSQVWRPSPAVERSVRQAVDSTAGVVITEKNALIKTFFSSECGGYTADARWVFTKTPIVALSGVRCPRCADRSNRPSTWEVTYTRQEIVNRLRKAGLLRQQGEIRMLQALDAGGNPMGGNLGRAVTIEITFAGDRSATVRIPANQFRMAMGHKKDNVASTYMVIKGGGEPRITFSGYGWGHGVGLCQYGAAYAADKLKMGYLDILALYYPGSKPVRLWGR